MAPSRHLREGHPVSCAVGTHAPCPVGWVLTPHVLCGGYSHPMSCAVGTHTPCPVE
ncbi:hypothetical protein ACRRTK_012575 [Alexandromys fortis]